MHLELEARLKLGVSSCLTGERVRHDGDHRREHWLMDRVAAFSELSPVCPELILGVPREPVHLERDADGALHLRGNESGTDHTATLSDWAEACLDALDLDALDGWVFKSGSPSCAVQPVDVQENGQVAGRVPGRFAAAVLDRCAWLPVIDEVALGDPAQRRHFLEQAFARAHWRSFLDQLPTDPALRDAAVAAWLARFDLQLIAREGSVVRAHPGTCDASVLRSHGHLLFAGLSATATRVGQVAALRAAGDHLDVHGDERAAFAILIAEYAGGKMDVEVPRQLLRGLCARGGDAWLRAQRFLDPFPVAWLDPAAPSRPLAAHAKD